MEVAITAIGTANPMYKSHQLAIANLVIDKLNLTPTEKRRLLSIYKATGIEYRYSVLSDYSTAEGQAKFYPEHPNASFPTTSGRMKIYKDHALKLAISAIENCLANSENVELKSITHLVTVSCTGMYAPGIDIEIVQQLKLNSSTKRTAINFMGCYGAFNGIKIADAICRAEESATILIICVELCTIHFQKMTTLDHIISNSIFSDGAAAVLIQKKYRNKKCLHLKNFYCDLIPQTQQEMAWRIGDHGFDISLDAYVPEILQSGIVNFVSSLLDQCEISFANIDFFAIHPGGRKILQACEKALAVTEKQNEHSYHVLKNYGNMSSATILFVLKKIWDELDQKDSMKNIFCCAFGPGLTLESMILRTACV